MSLANSTVLVAGASGSLGRHITTALLESKKFKEVQLLFRAESLQDEKKKSEIDSFKSKGAIIVQGDVMKLETLNFSGVDVIISVLSGAAIYQGQFNLIEAAKKFGVKRFIPSEFGADTTDANKINGKKYPMFEPKLKVQEAIKSSGLNYTFIITGMFMESIFYPFWSGIDLNNKKVNVPGTGKEKILVTHTADIAKAVVDILLNPKSKNTAVKIVGDTLTYDKILSLLQSNGSKFEVTYESVENLRKKIDGNPNPFETVVEQLRAVVGSGDGDIPVNNNADYPNIHFTTFAKFWNSRN